LAPLHYAQLQPMIIIKKVNFRASSCSDVFNVFLSVANRVSVFLVVLGRIRPFFYETGAIFPPFFGPCWSFLTILSHFGPFWALFGPFWGPKWPREPQNAGVNRPKWAKRGSTSHKNVFWDRFRPFGGHWTPFGSEKKNRKKNIFRHFLTFFDMSEIC